VPELLEVESYRVAAERAVGREVAAVDAPDAWYLKGGLGAAELTDVLVGARVVAARRHGKLLLVPLDVGPVLGLRFGMTGRLVVDGEAPIERLEYSSDRVDPTWERFALRFADGGSLVVVDPRRLGGVALDPDTSALGPDAATLRAAELRRAVQGRRAPLKAVLLDQAAVAGLGNLLVDETLWRAGIAPTRAADSLDRAECAALARTVRATVRDLGRRGGSHTGDLQVARARGSLCPRCGAPLRRDTVGGRTTYWCPVDQHAEPATVAGGAPGRRTGDR
jgi:formamidopyrimidine-DNA glycosylase